MRESAPSTPRVMALLARLAARRLWNRFSVDLGRKKGRTAGEQAPRRATPGKHRRRGLLVALFAPLFLFQGLMMSGQLLSRIVELVSVNDEDSAKIPLHSFVYDSLEELDRERDGASPGSPPETDGSAMARARGLFEFEVSLDPDYGDRDELQPEGVERRDELLEVFRREGIEAFRRRARPEFDFLAGVSWPEEGPARSRALGLVGLILLILTAGLFLSGLSAANQDLGRVEWSVEWLFTFPVPASTLLLARTFEYAIVTLFPWFTVFPWMLAATWTSGHGLWGIPLAVVATLYVTLLVAASRVVSETWLRKHVSLARLKNIQALASIGTMLFLFAAIYPAVARELPEGVRVVGDLAPAAVLWCPAAWPALLCRDGMVASGVLLLLLSGAGVAGAAAKYGGGRILRDGLVSAGGAAYRVRRPGKRAARIRRRLRAGIVGKDLLLLLRDRNFFVQTLVLPVAIVGIQLLFNPAILRAGEGEPRNAALLAYAIGAYVLMFGGVSVLSTEGPCLWLLYTFPRELRELLRRKAWLWCGVGLVYCGTILALLAAFGGGMGPAFFGASLSALGGICVCGFIAAGLGVLHTDPFETRAQRRVRPGATFLYMFLASLYAWSIYSPSPWTRVVLFVLFALVAYAIWERAREHIPWLLDPVSAPAPRFYVGDGLVATLAFFVLQGLTFWAISGVGGAEGAEGTAASLVASYAVAGLVVVAGSLLALGWRGIPDLAARLGIVAPAPRVATIARAAGAGLAGGAVAAAGGVAWLVLLEHVPVLRAWRDAALHTPFLGGLDGLWVVILAVLAAPLFEEFIFRGVLLQGLRPSLRSGWAVPASAALFALVHPPIAVAPVFVLGLVTGALRCRTGFLLAPVIAHAVYNAVVVPWS